MTLRYALLTLLTEGEGHGYQLLKRFKERVGSFWHPNIGQVYQLLHELQRRGFVTRRDERDRPLAHGNFGMIDGAPFTP